MLKTNHSRLNVYNLFEHPVDTILSRTINYLIIGLILLNVVGTVIESVPGIYHQHSVFFDAFEVLSVLVFTVEYLLRVWSSIEAEDAKGMSAIRARLRHMASPLAIIDAIAIIPFYLSMLVSVDLRFLRFFRLLRIFKLVRYSRSLDILTTVMRNESQSFLMTLSILLTVLLLSAGGIHIFERDLQPEDFGSIPQAMWWAVATLTTVGYGDVTPLTVGGKIFGALVMVVGIGMVALPTGILSSAFSEEIRYRRDLYLAKLDEALQDGRISKGQELTLGQLREELLISEKEAREMLQIARHRGNIKKDKSCHCCGRPL